ncbi:hypothetical protein P171DRAFT_442417 [Karstenula rhodostoma CBS 690.94]|uniref:Uncharacterized protein n=1 Tax=Karstenula rhodostoma CBS 690.94 TaxID=1392251 RepID=A0A9P4UEM6_9PLEO|nr:hypothetical protein P171DRAFT_442417 [Karstenula rhodostoma CBS 690.94]
MFGAIGDLFSTAANLYSFLGPKLAPFSSEAAASFISQLYNKIIALLSTYIAEHPFWFAYDLVATTLFFVPGTLIGPILRAIGFTRTGPAIGTWAARMMSKFGPVVARGWYAICQSSQMGGYGLAIAKSVTRASAVVLQGIGAAFRIWGS